MLTSELEAIQLTSPQMPPEATFGFGGVLAKMAGVVGHAPRTSLPWGATMTWKQPSVAF
jgi:hypothetical protein